MKTPRKNSFDLAAIRAKLHGVGGQRYWRSLDEVAETEEFQEMLRREFPGGASEWLEGLNRRSFLKLAAASLALAGLSACTRQPVQPIIPYTRQPEQLVPGEPLVYATAMTLGGFANGALVKSREGHPVKIDGNPEHPATRGGSDVWLQASILDLYDPDRSSAVTHRGEISTWASLLEALSGLTREHEANHGAGLRFLTQTVTSPTLAAQLRELLQKFPAAKWHQWEPISRDAVRAGAELAFGEIVETHYRFDRAAIVLSLDSDFLATHPDRLHYAHDFTDARRVSAGRKEMNRLYVVESTPTITGTMADHRLPIGSAEIEDVARWIAELLGIVPSRRSRDNETQTSAESQSLLTSTPTSEAWLLALVRDLLRNRGRSVIVVGEGQPPMVHALAHWLNDVLGNVGETVFYTESAEAQPAGQLASLRELADEMKAGAVTTLFVLGGNPAYDAPADFEFGPRLRNVGRSLHLGLERNETAALCVWHVPQAHWLESWSDARAFDGTASLIQPLIAPLYDGRTAHELLGVITQPQPLRTDYEIVRAHWQSQNLWPDFDKGWRRALHDGFIENTSAPAKAVSLKTAAIVELANQSAIGNRKSEIEITFRPDASVWDGRFANNGWLQECPRPVSKLTWDNAALVSPAFAERHGLANDDVIELSVAGRVVRAPVWILPGQAENSITLPLGYGRARVGRVGRGAGFNAYAVRTADGLWLARDVKFSKTNMRRHLVATQTHHRIDSVDRQIYRAGTLEEFLATPGFVKSSSEIPKNGQTLYNVDEFGHDGSKWAMSIDLTTCIGCNACLVACEVENNIPVVGRDQVDRNREMFWIRIDTYFEGAPENPSFNHQPVPCMHCEHAPCELVCPVAATVHDHEGLNLQIYNRCVGTRFCSNNCPYKVRRFNFFQYADPSPALQPMRNPEVTVRSRGVMEKCTYCIQRIARARIAAEQGNRRIRDHEVSTACQQACPADAIVFGDLNDPDSRVAKLKAHPLDYPMLGQLNTRPRTTYLAKLRNPNPEIERNMPV